MDNEQEWLEYKKQFPITIERALGAHGPFFTAALNHPLIKRSGAKLARPNLEAELNNFAKEIFTAGLVRGLTTKKVEELKKQSDAIPPTNHDNIQKQEV